MKNALSIINFNSSPVNIKKHDALLLILYVFEINFCFPLIIHFTDFNQVGINVSALQIKKHNREQIQYLTEKKNFENTATTMLQYVFLVLLLRGMELIKMQ